MVNIFLFKNIYSLYKINFIKNIEQNILFESYIMPLPTTANAALEEASKRWN